MNSDIFLKLVSQLDFYKLRKRFIALSNDFHSIRPEKKSLIILDYFVLYVLCSDEQDFFRKKLAEYCINSDLIKDSLKVVLPITYWEMDGNIKHVKKNIASVTSHDFKLLNENDIFIEFRECINKWKNQTDDSDLRRNALIAFKNILSLEFEDKNITHIFLKVINFFYYDKIYISSYKKILDLIKNPNFNVLSTEDILQITESRGFKYDKELFETCFRFLHNYRKKGRSDFVDAISYATTVNIQELTENKYNVNMYSSDIPFEIFFFNELLGKSHVSPIRDTTHYSIARLIVNQSKNDIVKIKAYIDDIFKKINIILNEKDYGLRQSILAKKQLREKIREKLIFSIKANKKPQKSPLKVLFDNLSIEGFVDDDELRHVWSDNILDFIERLDGLLSLSKEKMIEQIENMKKSSIAEIDTFLTFFS